MTFPPFFPDVGYEAQQENIPLPPHDPAMTELPLAGRGPRSESHNVNLAELELARTGELYS
jgi:hypothetical protein